MVLVFIDLMQFTRRLYIMVTNICIKKNIIICLVLTALSLSNAAVSENEEGITFQALTIHSGFDFARAQALGKALDFQNWPQTNVFRVAPSVDKSMLQRPDLVTREGKSYNTVQFGQDSWGWCKWWASYVTKIDLASLPNELPTDRKNEFLARLPEKVRNDPNQVEKLLQRMLERHRDAMQKYLEGSITVEIVVTPSSVAAQEYLLSRMIENTIPIEGLIGMYSSSEKSSEIGNLNFINTGRDNTKLIKFIRNNIVVNIDARGQFSTEAFPLAQKIDSAIKQQSPLTYQQLLSRRPSPAIAANIVQKRIDGQRSIPYSITVPNNRSIGKIKGVRYIFLTYNIHHSTNNQLSISKIRHRWNPQSIKNVFITSPN